MSVTSHARRAHRVPSPNEIGHGTTTAGDPHRTGRLPSNDYESGRALAPSAVIGGGVAIRPGGCDRLARSAAARVVFHDPGESTSPWWKDEQGPELVPANATCGTVTADQPRIRRTDIQIERSVRSDEAGGVDDCGVRSLAERLRGADGNAGLDFFDTLTGKYIELTTPARWPSSRRTHGTVPAATLPTTCRADW